jgi:chromosome segregation ATPase
MADLAADNEKQTESVHQLRAELEEQATFKAEQAGQLARLIDELRVAREELAGERREAELARQELAKTQSRLEAQVALESELRQLRTDFEAERAARVRAEQMAAVLNAQKDFLEAQVAELKEAASIQIRMQGASGERQTGKRTEHSSPTFARRGKNVEGPSDPGTPGPEHATDSAAFAAGEAVDPRQGKLC